MVDRAGGFDAPGEVSAVPEADPRREGGFGLPLIGALADEAEIRPAPDGTEIHLVILRGAAGAG